tara:strand:- start:20939 stop:21187 length:249 start_codon:yes stop_codon:yes gene_type:complete
MPPKRKKPPTPSLEQEAKDFLKKSTEEILPDIVPQQSLPTPRELLAASVLSGLLVSGRGQRAEELVEEAYRYVDILLRYNNK